MRKRTKNIDYLLAGAVILLIFLGLILVTTASFPEGYQKHDGDVYHFLKQHLKHLAVGSIVFLITVNLDYKIYKRFSNVIYMLSFIPVFLLFTPLAVNLHGATRWVSLGVMTYMPAEGVKFSTIIMVAGYLSKRDRNIRNIKEGLIPVIAIMLLSIASVLMTKDLSSSFILAVTISSIMFAGGMHLMLVLLGGVAGSIAIYFLITMEQYAYRMKRIVAFMNPFADPQDTGHQVVQSLYAIANGGIFGTGIGEGMQKYYYLPEAYSDFIFAIAVEELGFLGCSFIVILYMIIFWRGMKISLSTKDLFARFIAFGMTVMLCFQAVIHMHVTTSTVPNTGLPLPFISHGGTSLMISMACAGILLNISRYSEVIEEEIEEI